MGWIMSLRPLASGLATFLVAYSYWASGASVNILVCVCTFVLTGTFMAWNDWCDRHHDSQISKNFALIHGARYLWYCVGLWCITGVLVFATATECWRSGLLGLSLMMGGLLYTYSRRIVLLPEIYCAGCLTAVMFYPMTEGYSALPWHLYVMVGIFNLAREHIKDTDHPMIDVGWKKTLSVMFGNRTAVITARFMLGFAIIVGLLAAATTSSTYIAAIQTLGMLTMAIAGYGLLGAWFPTARKAMDAGALVFFLGGTVGVKSLSPFATTGTVVPISYMPKDMGSKAGFPEWYPEQVKQPRWIWSVMILSLFVVVGGLRFVTATAQTTRIFLSGTPTEAMITGAMVVGLFLVLFFVPFFAPAFDDTERSETRGYRIVKRMSSGLLLGIVCSVIGGETLVAPAAMVLICVLAIIWHPTACWVLKQRGFQLGTIIGFALIGGIGYGLVQFLAAYVPVVIFYYLYRYFRPGSD